MGKKGKNKNATVVNESSPKLEEVVEKKPETKVEVKAEPPKVEIKKEPKVEEKPKIEVKQEEPKVVETPENNSDTLKSKKKRNKNNKSNFFSPTLNFMLINY